METSQGRPPKASVNTGVAGLDEILPGGFPAHRLYLVEGMPGTGKTTLALQFLLEGRRAGERGLYVTLSETKEELQEVAESHGWSLEGIDLYELGSSEARLKPEQGYTVFHPEEIELTETTQNVYDEVERIKPSRVVFDSLSEMRLLSREPLRYRRQILSLKQFFVGRQCTVLLLDDTVGRNSDFQLQSISHGVLSLERLGQEYGISRRRLNIVKLRGSKFRDGYHDYQIGTGGIRVFPRLVAAEHRHERASTLFVSGIRELDELLGGGLSGGTSTLITGAAGAGKSCLAGSFLRAAVREGHYATAYVFEETRHTYLDRMAGINMNLAEYIDSGRLAVHQVDPAEMSPGELASRLRVEVEHKHAKVVVIDSISGYVNALPNEQFLLTQLHEVLNYLSEYGVLTILIAAQSGTIGPVQTTADVSYLADTLVLVRFFEHRGALKKAISVVKHRKSAHEETIRELQITGEGIRIGRALTVFRGVLSGTPEYLGESEDLMDVEERR
ncbi:MAG TPA: ATPase domain-containing protein [Bryobacteraceae bacterium]|nr:ATPase domain-containing protein [Bryobacteraceae bacterium]